MSEFNLRTASAMNVCLGEWAHAVNGHTDSPDVIGIGVSTDSRQIQPGDVYVALKGDRFDGHDFIAEAFNKGAVAVVVDNTYAHTVTGACLRVNDTLSALQAMAAHWRQRFSIPIVAVAGSNGKTTSKHLLAALLSPIGAVHATMGSLNNHIGVPLTLLGLRATHRAAVIEVGANHPGEVAHLCGLVKPTFGLVTNAGLEHLEGFGSIEGAARAEGELFESLGSNTVAVVNIDDEFAQLWRTQIKPHTRIREFSLTDPAEVCLISSITSDDQYRQYFTVRVDGQNHAICLPLAGRHNVANLLGVLAVSTAMGVPVAQSLKALSQVQAVNGRLQMHRLANGKLLIDDTYNANPSSVSAALQVLVTHPAPHGVILGGMGELGEHSLSAHQQVAVAARDLGVKWLWTVGQDAEHAAQSFGASARHFSDVETLLATSSTELPSFSSLLIKGSRFNRLERVVNRLMQLSASPEGLAACSTI